MVDFISFRDRFRPVVILTRTRWGGEAGVCPGAGSLVGTSHSLGGSSPPHTATLPLL